MPMLQYAAFGQAFSITTGRMHVFKYAYQILIPKWNIVRISDLCVGIVRDSKLLFSKDPAPFCQQPTNQFRMN
jgi:hypothetical protein